MSAFFVLQGAVPANAARPNCPIVGSFALQGSRAETQSCMRDVHDRRDPSQRLLIISMTRSSDGALLHQYNLDMTKYAHLIIVSDDFSYFSHLHPELSHDGHFYIRVHFPRPALYHAYIDAEPVGIGQQVFRFDVDTSPSHAHAVRDLSERRTSARVGPYAVLLSTRTLAMLAPTELTVTITKGGTLADDLHPYLGALAHAVFINAGDLTYLHVHPMRHSEPRSNMGSMSMPMGAENTASPTMVLHVLARTAGTYMLWLQFVGGTKLYVAPFVLTTR